MTERIEYGSKEAADAARDRHDEYLCPVDDDRRLKTVAYTSDTPSDVLDTERLEAADGRGERSDGPGQVPLSDGEKDRIDFSASRANVPHAKSVKGIAQAEGVEDWTSYYDGSLTVDEHREVMAKAATESGTRGADETADEKAGRAARSAKSNQCDHAKGHCENGDPEACEFLTQTCGYDEQEVAQFIDDTDGRADEPEQQDLVTVGGDEYPEMEVTPEVAGALRRGWKGYKGGIGDLDDALSAAREAVINARQAWRAINRIREAHGQPEMHPDRLHTLLDALEAMPGNIPEVRTLSHFADPGSAPVGGETTDENSQQFASEQQGTLSSGVEAEQAAEEKQVTLTGSDEAGNETAPTAWRRRGSNWDGGPHTVQLDSHGRGDWVVKLTGPAGPVDVATRLPDPTTAEEVAEEFTNRVQPNEVSGHNADGAVQNAAAAAKKAALPNSGGLADY